MGKHRTSWLCRRNEARYSVSTLISSPGLATILAEPEVTVQQPTSMFKAQLFRIRLCTTLKLNPPAMSITCMLVCVFLACAPGKPKDSPSFDFQESMPMDIYLMYYNFLMGLRLAPQCHQGWPAIDVVSPREHCKYSIKEACLSLRGDPSIRG